MKTPENRNGTNSKKMIFIGMEVLGGLTITGISGYALAGNKEMGLSLLKVLEGVGMGVGLALIVWGALTTIRYEIK